MSVIQYQNVDICFSLSLLGLNPFNTDICIRNEDTYVSILEILISLFKSEIKIYVYEIEISASKLEISVSKWRYLYLK